MAGAVVILNKNNSFLINVKATFHMEMVNLSGGDPPRLRAESPSTPLPSSLLLLFQILIIAFIQKMSAIHQVLLGSSQHTLSLSLLATLPSRGDSIHFKDGETET